MPTINPADAVSGTAADAAAPVPTAIDPTCIEQLGGAPTGKPACALAKPAGRSRRHRPVLALTVVLLVVLLLCTASAPASAQGAAGVLLAQVQSVDQVLTNIRNWLMGILAGLATVMATIGGIRYTMADGDPGEVQRAKQAFRNAGLGFALAALAPLLVTVLQGVVGL